MKYLVVVLVVGLVLWAMFKRSGRPAAPPASQARGRGAGPTQPMVECAHCGVHLPAADALSDGTRHYCGEAHRRLGPRAPGG